MNCLRLPGLIDIHVHLRDPGQTHKEDFYTGTCAALAGGVTTVLDMPNNQEPVFTLKSLLEKIDIAKKKAVCDFGLYFGSNGKNLEEFEKVENHTVGLKIYLNATTGNLKIDDDGLVEEIFYRWPKDKVIVAHAEEEKFDLAINLCRKYKNKLHFTHIVRGGDLDKVIAAKNKGINITCDTTPNYLFLTEDDEKRLAGFGKIKPPLSTVDDQKYLWRHLKDIDCLCTDHAPHTIEEKRSDNPPSGMPGLETMLPLLLTAVNQNRLTIEDLVRMTNTNPQKIFGFDRNNETYVEADLDEEYAIRNKDLRTRCGWSQFDGWKVKGKVEKVFLRRKIAYGDNKVLTDQGFGKMVTGGRS